MPIETTYSKAREGLKGLMDRAVEDREVVLVRRRKGAMWPSWPPMNWQAYWERPTCCAHPQTRSVCSRP